MARIDLARLSDVSAGVPSGTSFPGSPTTNDLFYRTDRALLYYYDGTRWLTVEEYPAHMSNLDTGTQGANLAPSLWATVDEGANGAWVTRIVSTSYQGAGSGSAYLTYQFVSRAIDGTAHNLGASFNTSADTSARFTRHAVTVGAVVTAADTQFYVSGVKTGAPTTLYFMATLFYRLIG